jgi:8-oxo-dGTP diphosphatase
VAHAERLGDLPDGVLAAGVHLRAAFETEAARIRALTPPDAFEESTGLVKRADLRALAGDLRAEQALRIIDSGAMTMTELAAHVGVERQAIFHLVKRAREIAAAQTAKPEPQPVVSAVVTSRKGVLVTKRRDGSPPWAFVGGEIDQGESPADAGLRELKEETGMVGTAGREIGRRIHPATGRLMIYMAVRPARGKTDVFVGDPAELEEVRWVTASEAQELMPTMYEPVREHLARTLRG